MSFEIRVDNYVRTALDAGCKNVHEKNDLPLHLKNALSGASKSGKGTGLPDFAVTYPDFNDGLAVVVENKYGLNKLSHTNDKGVYSKTQKEVRDYAVNGAQHYANFLLKNRACKEVLAVGIAGETINDNLVLKGEVFYYFSPDHEPKKIEIPNVDYLLQKISDTELPSFYQEIRLTKEEKESVLAKNYADLKTVAKNLNRLFYQFSVTVEQRAIFVSGMMLAMENGLKPEGLSGAPAGSPTSDGKTICNHIDTLLSAKNMPHEKKEMMMSIFRVISSDTHKDKPQSGTGKKGEKLSPVSINKEIFTFIYNNVWLKIDQASHVDSLGELYSEFLKFALGDGKEIGIVLTPPYVTQAMCELVGVDSSSRVFDPCTGSAGFLIAAMSAMISDAHNKYAGKELKDKVQEIKSNQLMGVELDSKMFTLAATNMILRGDGSSNIVKDSVFSVTSPSGNKVKSFAPTKTLLNPPFSYQENGTPFSLVSLDDMAEGGICAMIIQDSAGTGKSVVSNKQILERHTLLSSIKMPGDLFMPSAGVQTSIYIFKAHTPHDYKNKVRFIDFSEDGYKRTKRGTRVIGTPEKRYRDLVGVYKYGDNADNESNIEFIDDTITDSGADWNYTQHQVYDTTPTEDDFRKTVADYMSFELSMILQGKGHLIGLDDDTLKRVNAIARGETVEVTSSPVNSGDNTMLKKEVSTDNVGNVAVNKEG